MSRPGTQPRPADARPMHLKRHCRSPSCHTRTHRLSQCWWPETQCLLSSEGQSPGLQTEIIFLCPHRAEKTVKLTLRSLSIRALIPPQGLHPNGLIPSQRPHLLTASHEVLARQHLNGGHNIQSTARTETQTFLEVDTGRGHGSHACKGTRQLRWTPAGREGSGRGRRTQGWAPGLPLQPWDLRHTS